MKSGTDVREDPGSSLIIDQVLLGRFSVFSYLITDLVSREAMLVDPPGELEKIVVLARERRSWIRWIVCTHAHPDHVVGVASSKRLTDAPFAIHELEAGALARLTTRMMVRFLGGKPPPAVDLFLRDGQQLPLGGREICVLHTPGHSPGSICLRVEGNLFTGDTLFVGAVGRTDLPGSSPSELTKSMARKILCLPMETRIWPGHHYGVRPQSTLAVEVRHNPFVRGVLRRGAGEVAGWKAEEVIDAQREGDA